MGGIFINQAGYRPDSVKLAVMPFEADSISVVDFYDNEIYSAKAVLWGEDANSGDTVYCADGDYLEI